MKTYTKPYVAPQLTVYGDVAEITATLGDPFTGDTSYDLDGDPILSDGFSVDQCGVDRQGNPIPPCNQGGK